MNLARSIALSLLAGAAGFGTLHAQAPAISRAQWREDLQTFAKELPKRHKNAFHATPREHFERAVAKLDAEISSLEGHQVLVRMQQIAAAVGDGHTGMHLTQIFTRYPLGLYWFGPELRVIGGATRYQRAIGTRVVSIGGVPIAEVQRRVSTCFPSAANENEWYVLSTSPAFMRPEFLHTLGVVPGLGAASFTFEDDQGKQFSLEITPVDTPPGAPGTTAVSAAKSQPLYRQRPAETFWFTYLEDSRTVYVNWRSYKSLGDHAKRLFELVDQHTGAKLVIDLRQNGGGDFFEGRKHMIRPILERRALNQKGLLFVITGRATFSAALANAVDFRKDTNAILVGEPIGERPNSYSENDEFTLPNSRVVVSYSTKYYQFVPEEVPAVMPDHRIDPDWPAFRDGRDPVLEWILAYRKDG